MNRLDVYSNIGRICKMVSAKLGSYFTFNLLRNELGIAFNTANRLVEKTAVLGIVEEVTGGQRFSIFRYTPYWRLLQEPEPMAGQGVPVQTTEATR